MDARAAAGLHAATLDRRRGALLLWRWIAASCAVAALVLAWRALGPPPMEPLTAACLERAERLWHAAGSPSYHLVVRIRAPRFQAALYDVVVAGGRPVKIARDGVELAPDDVVGHDYSVAGLFELLRRDLVLAGVRAPGDVPAVDLRAQFEPATGRLVRYRRTVGAARRRVLLVEVLRYEPGPGGDASSSA